MRARALDERPSRLEGLWVPCRRCGADDAVPVVRSEERLLGLGGEFQVVRCRRCGFLYTSPQPDDATLARHYPPGYQAPPAAPGASGRRGPRARLRAGALVSRGYDAEPPPGPLWRAGGRLASRLLAQRSFWLPPLVPDGTLVDVGCGSGAYLAEMRGLGWRVIGVEPSPEAARAARDLFGMDVRAATLEEAALLDGCADVVVMRMVLEHVRDPRKTLAEARRLLKPGGRLLVSVPNAGSIEARLFGRHWFAWELPRHLSHFTPASLGGLLREEGFGRVRVRHLVSANNLAASVGYLLGRRGPALRWAARLLMPLAALESLARQSGRIAVEARRGGIAP